MCKISLEYNLKTKFSSKQVALQVELGEFRGNFGGVRKMFLKYLSVRCARKDTNLAQVRLASTTGQLSAYLRRGKWTKFVNCKLSFIKN